MPISGSNSPVWTLYAKHVFENAILGRDMPMLVRQNIYSAASFFSIRAELNGIRWQTREMTSYRWMVGSKVDLQVDKFSHACKIGCSKPFFNNSHRCGNIKWPSCSKKIGIQKYLKQFVMDFHWPVTQIDCGWLESPYQGRGGHVSYGLVH